MSSSHDEEELVEYVFVFDPEVARKNIEATHANMEAIVAAHTISDPCCHETIELLEELGGSEKV